MAIVILSAQHTGTNFTMSYLHYLGVVFRQYHSDPLYYEDATHETSNKAVIPLRDPLLAYTSTFLRNPNQDNLEIVDLRFKLLKKMTAWFEHVHFRLAAEDRDAELRKVADFCGYEGEINFDWIPVNNLNVKVTDYETWEIVSSHIGEDRSKQVLETLAPHREYYGYSTAGSI